MNEANLLKRLEFLVTGDGFWQDQDIDLREVYLHATGATLTTTLSTNPGFAMVGTNNLMLSWAAGKVVKAGLQVNVPGDYDESSDELSIWILAKMSGSTDTPTLTFEAFKHSASTTDLAPSASAALSSSYQWLEINLDGNSIAPNGVLGLTIVPGTHGTDAVQIAAIKMRYRSSLVIDDMDERSDGTVA